MGRCIAVWTLEVGCQKGIEVWMNEWINEWINELMIENILLPHNIWYKYKQKTYHNRQKVVSESIAFIWRLPDKSKTESSPDYRRATSGLNNKVYATCILTRCSAIAERPRCKVCYSFRQKQNTRTGRQSFTDIIGLSSTTVI